MQLEDEEEEEEEEQSSLGQEIIAPKVLSSEDPLAFTGEDIRQIGKSNSRMGYCGLQNLGNTCFMNSGLQCLSNTTELTKYFAFNLWRKDVNKDNPLGMKGKLATAYADLILEMWKGGSSSTAPWEVKQMIGKKVQKFSGFGQQDSCELLNYLLDILHEDLNRIQKKPYVEMKDSDGRPDEVVAQEFWDGFRARNDSVIVDLMYGQYKSTVTCQECKNVSNNFDPFMTLSLPIPKRVNFEFYYLSLDFFNENGEKKALADLT